MSTASMAALYDGAGSLLLGSCNFGFDVMIANSPCCRLLLDADSPGDPAAETVDRILWCPPDGVASLISPAILAELVAVLDKGGRVAVHGDDWKAIQAAIDAVLQMAGGWHA